MTKTISPAIPRIGMLAKVRNRRGIISSVETFDGGVEGQTHLVRVEYLDREGVAEDDLIWEREPLADVLEPTALPRIADQAPMVPQDFSAFQRATRWTALTPYLPYDLTQAKSINSSLENSTLDANPVPAAPFFGALQVEDFQLVPLLKALGMPRISLLLADDVGLGKTVEAGLILSELLLRRRIRKVLILCPAALRKQWQNEMQDKFALSFDIIDRQETHALQKRLGLDANPWRSFPRIITSYHYLRQPDVLEQFRSACQVAEITAHLPWDLLIVDEVHNLMPSNFGTDSDLSQMLRAIAPWFEHKLFLSATPHNGHTRCFSGLLEQLDPVRFIQTSEFTPAMNQRIQEVVIRRLKTEVNDWDRSAGLIPRFCERLLCPVPLHFGSAEKQLFQAFDQFKSAVKHLIQQSNKTEQLTGSFAVEVLNKRLLSCPYTFANSWYRLEAGVQQSEAVTASTVQSAKRSLAEDLDDDAETESRLQYAVETIGAWLKPLVAQLEDEIAGVNAALKELGILPDEEGKLAFPNEDERWNSFQEIIQEYLRSGDRWKGSERLVVFTEYKTTLDYLKARLEVIYGANSPLIQALYGGMQDQERDAIKQAFNDPDHPVKILLATDAASEGLNLQETAHIVLHYDIPWNPARLDQRNGRLDRHGQAEDVIVLHFTSEESADLRFLSRIVEKVNTIREELGSMGEVFDVAFQRRFVNLEDDRRIAEDLDRAIASYRGRTHIPRSHQASVGREALETLQQELDLTPHTLKETLEVALGMGYGLPRFSEPDEKGRLRLLHPIPPAWSAIVNDHLRQKENEALPAIAFDPQHFIQTRNGRPVYRASKDTKLLHLGHPLFQYALNLFARKRFPSGQDDHSFSRWIVRRGGVPQDMSAMLLLTVEELAVNELREPFHHWVRTLRFAIRNGNLAEMLDHLPAAQIEPAQTVTDNALVEHARDLWENLEDQVKAQLKSLTQLLTKTIQNKLQREFTIAQSQTQSRFSDRIREVKQALKMNSIQKLEQERDQLLQQMQQLELFAEDEKRQRERLKDLEDELQRRQNHYQGLLEQLEREQKRVLEQILPKRYTLRGTVQVFPVTIEIRIGEVMA